MDIRRLTEPKFLASEADDPLKKWSVLAGLSRYHVIFNPESDDDSPVRRQFVNQTDPLVRRFSIKLSHVLRHREQKDLMDAGGWMDTHTVCFIMKSFKDYDDPISVNKIVALVRAPHGEQFEITTYRPLPGDQRAESALDDRTAVACVDPIRGNSQFDPLTKPLSKGR